MPFCRASYLALSLNLSKMFLLLVGKFISCRSWNSKIAHNWISRKKTAHILFGVKPTQLFKRGCWKHEIGPMKLLSILQVERLLFGSLGEIRCQSSKGSWVNLWPSSCLGGWFPVQVWKLNGIRCGNRWQKEKLIQVKQRGKKKTRIILAMVERLQGEIIKAGSLLWHSLLAELKNPDSLVLRASCAWLCQVIFWITYFLTGLFKKL